jgi:hypothetical protein
MIRDGEPFLIDFQGMRFGSPFYDLGSLLCDPYVNLSDSERGELLSFYYGLSKSDLDLATFQNTFWEAWYSASCRPSGRMDIWGSRKDLKLTSSISPQDCNLRLATSHVSSLPRLGNCPRPARRPSTQKNLTGDFE